MNNNLITNLRKYTKGVLHISALVFLCMCLSGCWLKDIIEEIIEENYGTPSKIGIVVYPPFPFGVANKEDRDKVVKAFSLSDNVESSLLDGVAVFNSESKKTNIVPYYCKSSEVIFDFYDKIFTAAQVEGHEGSIKVRKVCKNQLKTLRYGLSTDNVSCIIFGWFNYKSSSQTAISITLCYYDWANDVLCFQQQVVALTNNRAQKSELERLMKKLLQKVYK